MGAFIGDLLFEGFYTVERRCAFAGVLLALVNRFEIAGGEVADAAQSGLHLR